MPSMPTCQLRTVTDEIFQNLDIHPNITMETAQDIIMYGLVAANHGIAITPYPLGGAPYNTKIVQIANNIPPRQLYLMWNREQYLPPAAEYFRDFIVRSGEVFTQFLEKGPFRSARMIHTQLYQDRSLTALLLSVQSGTATFSRKNDSFSSISCEIVGKAFVRSYFNYIPRK